MFIQDFFV